MGSQQNSRRGESVAVGMADGEPEVATFSLPECEHGQVTIPAYDNQVDPPAYDNCAKINYNDEAEVDESDINDDDNEDYSKKQSPYEIYVKRKREFNNEKLRSQAEK
jgi:hypothetical protein